MLAVVAGLVFLIGLVVRIVNTDFSLEDVWFWVLLGLTLLAFHHAWPLETWRRRA